MALNSAVTSYIELVNFVVSGTATWFPNLDGRTFLLHMDAL